MNDWVVETASFEDDLMNNRVVMLNQNGVNRVVEIINEKDKEIEDLKEQVEYQDLWRNEYLSRIDKAIEYMDNTYEINDLKELFKHYDNVEAILKGSDK